MSDHFAIIPDRPADWKPDRSIHMNMTDINGVHHTRKGNYGQLWQSFLTKSTERTEWEAKVFVAGQHHPIDPARVNRHYEAELIKEPKT